MIARKSLFYRFSSRQFGSFGLNGNKVQTSGVDPPDDTLEPYPIYLTVGGKTQRVYIRSHWFLSASLPNITYPSTFSFLGANAVS
ncbi:hypothetical protein Y032_0016g3035 [Ancylostoma ceylanicum]|uniref:Uncharacterized protein n=1 Tax=Ancylostoma ceylanicum TaxID=53326 RepID=A0A016V7F6_9BILA|nr:hypothetical protein Y032_0016g3035 [Ancylostoma ceylanicum]